MRPLIPAIQALYGWHSSILTRTPRYPEELEALTSLRFSRCACRRNISAGGSVWAGGGGGGTNSGWTVASAASTTVSEAAQGSPKAASCTGEMPGFSICTLGAVNDTVDDDVPGTTVSCDAVSARPDLASRLALEAGILVVWIAESM